MRKSWQKLLSLNLVILLLLSMPLCAFAEAALQVGDNQITQGAKYTFTPTQTGVYLIGVTNGSSFTIVLEEGYASYYGHKYDGRSSYFTLTAGTTYTIDLQQYSNITLSIERAVASEVITTSGWRWVEYGGKAVTFRPIFPGYYCFDGSIPVTLKNGSGKTVKSIGNEIYQLEGGQTYTLVGAKKGNDFVCVRELYRNLIGPINKTDWYVVTPIIGRSDLLVFSENGELKQMAFTDSSGQVTETYFYAEKGKNYYAINKEYAYIDNYAKQIMATSVDCVTLKENVKADIDYSYDDYGRLATFTPKKTGEYAWDCTSTSNVLLYDEELNAVPYTTKSITKGKRYTALLQAGKAYYFTVNAYISAVTVKNTWTDALKVFKDIGAKDWFVKNGSIDYAYNKGLFTGITPTTFEPNTAVTRGMFVTVLGRLHGVKSVKAATKFADVKKSAYYSGFVAWAAKNGIVTGVTNTTFVPDASVTREQICAIMYRYCDYANISLKKINKAVTFTDAHLISKYAKTAVTACQRGAIVNGKSAGKFDPKGKATRAEVATILMNFCNNYVK